MFLLEEIVVRKCSEQKGNGEYKVRMSVFECENMCSGLSEHHITSHHGISNESESWSLERGSIDTAEHRHHSCPWICVLELCFEV